MANAEKASSRNDRGRLTSFLRSTAHRPSYNEMLRSEGVFFSPIELVGADGKPDDIVVCGNLYLHPENPDGSPSGLLSENSVLHKAAKPGSVDPVVLEGSVVCRNAEIWPDVVIGPDNFISPGAEVFASTGERVRVGKSAVVRASHIGDFVMIGDYARVLGESVIGAHVEVGTHATVYDATLMDGCAVGPCSEIHEAVIGEDSRLGHHVFVGMGVQLPPRTVIPDYSRVLQDPDDPYGVLVSRLFHGDDALRGHLMR